MLLSDSRGPAMFRRNKVVMIAHGGKNQLLHIILANESAKQFLRFFFKASSLKFKLEGREGNHGKVWSEKGSVTRLGQMDISIKTFRTIGIYICSRNRSI